MGQFESGGKVLSCSICGYVGDRFVNINQNIYKCPACEALIDFGFSNEEESLLESAQSDLRRQEFDIAEDKFFDIIQRYPQNHKAYWGYVCSRYGIKHEEDYNGKIIPTCCLDSIKSFKRDKYYYKAVALAPQDVSDWYIEQAEYIENISFKWINEAQKEQPYDIFICFKDSDKANGIDRTQDSVDATEIYAWLLDKGYKVFLSRISLQDKVGDKYEPFIFNALQTAKVMIVYGSKTEYITSTWMKNEWHRFCKRISLGEKKGNSLIVAYKNFEPNELPSILASKQCLNYADNKFYFNLSVYLNKIFNETSDKQEKYNHIDKTDEIHVQAKSELSIIEGHVHKYIKTQIVPASCISRGYTIHQCECGDKYKDNYTSLVEHAFTLNNKILPTCKNEGRFSFVCSVCGEKKEQTVSAIGHTFVDWEINKPPTCLDKGTETGRCSICGKIETREISATGHKFSNWQIAKDWIHESRVCVNCGFTESRIADEASIIAYKQAKLKDYVIRKGVLIKYKGRDANIIIPETVTSIGSHAFKNCSSLTSVVIPNSVTSIGGYAFSGCSKLTSVTIPNSVTSIGNYTFYECSKLTSVTIPNSVTLIGDRAFYNCSSLTSITIPNSVTSIDYFAFEYCYKLVEVINLSKLDITKGSSSNGYVGCYALNIKKSGSSDIVNKDGYLFYTVDNTNYLFGYVGNETELVLPDNYNGQSYVINKYAFAECSSLTSIEIPNSVTSIGEGAFEDCSSLTSVNYTGSIDDWVQIDFSNSDANPLHDSESKILNTILKTITKNLYINNKLVIEANITKATKINDYAFSSCSSLTSVTIGNSVTSIGSSAFRDCISLTSIEVHENNKNYKSIDGNLYSNDGKTLIQYAIGKTNTTFTIPEVVTSIGDRAFYKCSSLTSVVIPNSVTSIGDRAFEDCSSLTSITIPNSVTEIGWCAFGDCSSLTSVIIPNSVTSIGSYAFSGCRSLTSIEIPNSVTSIGSYAFYDCSSLTSITIPNSVKSIGYEAFDACSSLTSITIPNSVTSIGKYAFRDCTSLISIKIPNSVTSIGEGAFSSCHSLTSIKIPNSVTSIGSYAFYECSRLTSVTIPEVVTSIGKYAFFGCYSLTSVTIGNSITSIGNYAFLGCRSLTSITIPNSVTSIGDKAFYGCDKLFEVYYIGNETEWKMISIDATNTPLENAARYYYIEEYPTEFKANTYWHYVNGVPTVWEEKNICSEGLTYQLINNDTEYEVTGIGTCTDTDIVVPDTYEGKPVTSIGYEAFYNCSSLTSIEIPNSVTSIGEGAFSSCHSLTSVTIGNSVTSIGDDAFYKCSSLTSVYWNAINCITAGSSSYPIFKDCSKLSTVVIGDNVKSIPAYAFYNCSSLTSVTIANSVTSIGYEAFYNCSSLTSVTIANSVTSIGSRAFFDCSKLTSVNYTGSIDDWVQIKGLYNLMYYGSSNKLLYIDNKLVTEAVITKATEINGYAFWGCSSLTSVTIGNSVTSIGNYAFCYCSSLTSVTIPNSVTSIGYKAFYDCSKLTTINYNGTKAKWQAIKKDSDWKIGVPSYCKVKCTDGEISV